MKSLKYILITLAVGVLISCSNSATEDTSTASAEDESERTGQAFMEGDVGKPNCLQIAISSPDHTTLVAAVQAAEVENSLVNVGPLTVFAPTDEAFAALPEGTVEDLLKPENKGALANILKYHVTPGNLKSDFLVRFKKLGQANNQNVAVEVIEGKAVVGGANIIASVPAGNGIVHVIDKVLLPPTEE